MFLHHHQPPHTNAQLVESLERGGVIKSRRVRAAMSSVDRLYYSSDTTLAYIDTPHDIGYNATISAPHMHAMCLEALSPSLQPGANVLDVGCGSGYLSACMAAMVGPDGHVTGLDHIPELVNLSIDNTKRGNPDLMPLITYTVGDGREGYAEAGPYDAIHVGAAAVEIPPRLVSQLKPGGRMVIPVGRYHQTLQLITKEPTGGLTETSLAGVRFVPLTNRVAQLGHGGM